MQFVYRVRDLEFTIMVYIRLHGRALVLHLQLLGVIDGQSFPYWFRLPPPPLKICFLMQFARIHLNIPFPQLPTAHHLMLSAASLSSWNLVLRQLISSTSTMFVLHRNVLLLSYLYCIRLFCLHPTPKGSHGNLV